jgi:hypothetical protein
VTQLAYKNALIAQQLGGNTPAWRIVCRPGHELWNHMATNDGLVDQLCQNFHDYGRTNGWRWIAATGQNTQPMLGRPLIAGTTDRTNCGGFNASVRWIASNILNLQAGDITQAGTTAKESFITRPGTTVIDAQWAGNVHTLLGDFATIQAYKFTGHSWSQLVGGGHYDATTDSRGFATKRDLYWCELGPTPQGRAGCFVVGWLRRGTPIPGPAPYYCISAEVLQQEQHQFPYVRWGALIGGPLYVSQAFIYSLPLETGEPRNWPAWLLVSHAHLPPGFLNNL